MSNDQKHTPTPERCKKELWKGWHRVRCSKNASKDGFCKTHHPDSVKARHDKSLANYQSQRAEENKQQAYINACVDAFKGVPDPAAEIARLQRIEATMDQAADDFEAQRDEIRLLTAERDRLREANGELQKDLDKALAIGLSGAVEVVKVRTECGELVTELKSLVRGYVSTLESASDIMRSLGRFVDSIEKMEAADPHLIRAKALIAKHSPQSVEKEGSK